MVISIPASSHFKTSAAFAATITPNSNSSPPRPAVILPGLGNNSSDYNKLQLTLLNNHGIPSVVPTVSRPDWLRNAAGLADPNYWRGTLTPRPILDWYLNRVHQAVSEAMLLAKGGELSLIGHSAGGWLARVYLEQYGKSHISLLLTLGTPHVPPPKGAPGVIDQTRGLLDYVQRYCSEAVYTPELKYVCIAGRYIKGERLLGSSLISADGGDLVTKDQAVGDVTVMNRSTTFGSRFVGQGYKQVCGHADAWGDGVVPEISAHLEGALNITLDGVYHSPVGSDDTLRPWYGSPAVVDQWVHHLLN